MQSATSCCLDCFSFICAVARIALVKPDKARGVEDVILRAAQVGQIAEKVASCTILSISDASLYRSLYVRCILSLGKTVQMTYG